MPVVVESVELTTASDTPEVARLPSDEEDAVVVSSGEGPHESFDVIGDAEVSYQSEVFDRSF